MPARYARRLVAATLITCFAFGGCGVSRSYLVEERPAEEAGPYIEAIARAARARGYEVRQEEERVARFVFDQESRGVLSFQVKRNGIVLVVKVADDEAPAAELDAAFAEGEALGRELMDEARVVYAQMLEEQRVEARLQAERERREAAEEEERDRQRAAQMEQNSDLAAFMAENQRRSRANAVGTDEPAPNESGGGAQNGSGAGGGGGAQNGSGAGGGGGAQNGSGAGGGGGAQNGSSAHCCVNGQFYDCPSASAVDQCVGRFTRCISGCGMSCIEQCLETDPPDPSSCTREPSRDGEC